MAPTKELVIMAFPTRGNLVDATDYINSYEGVKVHKSAILARAEDEEVTIYDDDITPVEGAVTGGTLGGIMGGLGVAGLGALLLPGIGPLVAVGIGIAAGAGIGGGLGAGAAKAMDFGINDKLLHKIAGHLTENEVAVVLELEGEPETLKTISETMAKDYAATTADPNVL